MKLDPTKEYQYRNGEKPWKIIWDVPNEKFPILSIGEAGRAIGHCEDGKFNEGHESHLDLIEVKKKIKGWVNVHPGSDGQPYLDDTLFDSELKARALGTGRIACIEIEFTEGEGL